MATGGDLSASVIGGSEEVIDCPCSVCIKDGAEVEAVKFCVDCQGNLCVTCVKWHGKFTGTSAHKMVDVSAAEQDSGGVPQLPTEKCLEHGGKVLDTYCPTHEAVCCATCVNINHRLCDGLDYLPKFAQGTLAGTGRQDTQVTIQALISDLQKLHHSRRLDVRDIFKDETAAIQEVNELRSRLIERIDTLIEDEIEKIKKKYEKDRNILHPVINDILKQIEMAKTDKQKLDDFVGNNESQMFCLIKASGKNVKDAKALLKRVEAISMDKETTFVIDSDIEDNLFNVKSLGRFGNNNIADSLRLKHEYDVKKKEDKSKCTLHDSCLLADGAVMFTDYQNERLIRLNMSNNKVDYFPLTGGPWGICSTGINEIAVTLIHDERIQCLSVSRSLRVLGSFVVQADCRGICCRFDNFYVTHGRLSPADTGCVRIYSKDGSVLRTIEKDPSGRRIFTVPYKIALSALGNVHVADQSGCVITLDTNGNVLSTFKDPGLTFAFGICSVEDQDAFIVADYNSHAIMKVVKDQKQTLLKNIMMGPQSVLIDPVNSLLIVTSYQSEIVKVFHLNN